MRKKVFFIFTLLLVATLTSTAASLLTEKVDLGEAIIVEVDYYEPRNPIPQAMLEQQNVPVYAHLQGVTAGTLLSGITGDQSYRDPITGITNIPPIERVQLTPTNRTSNYVTNYHYIKPKRNEYSLDNLGTMLIMLKKLNEEVPERIDLEFDAEITFKLDETLYGLSNQDKILTEIPSDEQWDNEITTNSDAYSFFSRQGFIRATQIDDHQARFIIYNKGKSVVSLISPTLQDTGVTTQAHVALGEGETSRVYSLQQTGDPFKDHFQIRLNKIVNPQDKAHVEITAAGRTSHTQLIKDEKIYTGSDWRVQKLDVAGTRHTVILRNSRGERKTLEVNFEEQESRYDMAMSKESAKDMFDKHCGDPHVTIFACDAIEHYQNFIDKHPNDPQAADMHYQIAEVYREHLITQIRPNYIFDMTSLAVYHYNQAFNIATDIDLKNDAEKKIDELRKADMSQAAAFLPDELASVTLKFVDKVQASDLATATIRHLNSAEKEHFIEGFLEKNGAEVIGTEQPRSRSRFARAETCRLEGETFSFKWKLEKVTSTSATVVQYCQDEAGSYTIRKGRSKRLLIDQDVEVPTEIVQGQVQNHETFRLTNVNPNREVFVTVIPGTGEAKTTSHFKTSVNVEKRPFELTPEKLQEHLDTTNEAIEKLDKINTNLEKVNEGWRKACTGTFLALSAKNALTGKRNHAREDVMAYYKKQCPGEYQTYDHCYQAKAQEITQTLNTATQQLTKADQQMQSIQQAYQQEESPEQLTSRDDELGEYARYRLAGGAASAYHEYLIQEKYKEGFDETTAFGADVREDDKSTAPVTTKIALYDDAVALKEANPQLSDQSVEEIIDSMQAAQALYNTELEGLQGAKALGRITKIAGTDDQYTGVTYNPNAEQDDVYNTQNLKILDECEFQIATFGEKKEGCDTSQTLQAETQEVFVKKADYPPTKGVQLYTTTTKIQGDVDLNQHYNYGNTITVEYDNDGLPLCYPTENGNYVHVIERYRTNEIRYLEERNVGPNGRIDCGPGGDDTIVPGGDASVLELPDKQAKKAQLKRKGDLPRCTQDGQRLGKIVDGKQLVCSMNQAKLNTQQSYPACAEYMDPQDCTLLFNACDPVMCPSSRCNLGGTWQTDDVISSGIVGSSILCAPNIKEGVAVPVCLTGINAGLKNIKSLMQEYRDCTQEQLETGKNVGICDKIRSVGTCELVWREAAAITNIKGGVINWITQRGQTKGGGEYLNFHQNMQGATDSFNYFTSTYEQTYLAAFKGRATEDIGTQVCKQMITGTMPKIGDIFNQISQVEEPPQFAAYFDELPYAQTIGTSEGIPGVYGADELSQYNVYYHIYAGKRFEQELDKPVRYAVYLKHPDGSQPLFVTNPNNGPRYGNIANEDYAAQNILTVGKAGYAEMCVWIDGEEFCGFSRVSTDKGLELISDGLQAADAQQQINTAEQCVPESARTSAALGGIVIPGQSGLTSSTITRVCSFNRPTTDDSRWQVVGTCGEERGSCWLDTTTLGINSPLIDEELRRQLEQQEQELLGEQEEFITADKAQEILLELFGKSTDAVNEMNKIDKEKVSKEEFEQTVQIEITQKIKVEETTYFDILTQAPTKEVEALATVDLGHYYTKAAKIQKAYKELEQRTTQIEEEREIDAEFIYEVDFNKDPAITIKKFPLPYPGEYVISYVIYDLEGNEHRFAWGDQSKGSKRLDASKINSQITSVDQSIVEQLIEELNGIGSKIVKIDFALWHEGEKKGLRKTIYTSQEGPEKERVPTVRPEEEEEEEEELTEQEGPKYGFEIDLERARAFIAWANDFQFRWNGAFGSANEEIQQDASYNEGIGKISELCDEKCIKITVTCLSKDGDAKEVIIKNDVEFDNTNNTDVRNTIEETIQGCRTQPLIQIEEDIEVDPQEITDISFDITRIRDEADLVRTDCVVGERSKELAKENLIASREELEGRSYLDLVEEETIDYNELLTVAAVIGAESKANTLEVSNTGAAGLMQFTYTGAEDVVLNRWDNFIDGSDFFDTYERCCGSSAENYRYNGRICSISNNRCADEGHTETDQRFNPTEAIPAGVAHLRDKRRDIINICNPVVEDIYLEAFAVDAYNAGQGVVCDAIELAEQNAEEITWENVGNRIVADDTRQAQCYVSKVYQFKEYFNGRLGTSEEVTPTSTEERLSGEGESVFDEETTGARILHIGASHTVGTYGQELHNLLREEYPNADIQTYARSGSRPTWWIQGSTANQLLSQTGIHRENQGSNVLSGAMPQSYFQQIIEDHNPDITIISLGTNMIDKIDQQSVITNTRTMAQLAQGTCFWVGPAQVGENAIEVFYENQDYAAEKIKEIVEAEGCIFIDARDFTDKNKAGGDGIHYHQNPEVLHDMAQGVLNEIVTN